MSGPDPAELDAALYDPDPVVRDAARSRLAREVPAADVPALVALLDAPQRMTRRRVARILSEIDPARVAPALRAALRDGDAAPRTRAGAARVLGVLADGEEPALGDGLADPVVRVRRASAQPAAPLDALRAALADDAPEVLARVAEALEARGEIPSPEVLRPALGRAPQAAALGRLLARAAPADAALIAAARAGDATALAHLADPVTLAALLDDHPVEAAWGLARLGAAPPADHRDPRVRAAAARALPPGDPDLARLVLDPDPGVAWLARRAQTGAFASAVIARRLAPHARSDAASARPPYGLRPGDSVPAVERAPAALALCHTRFDVNLGVAVRSAEAAGLREVVLMGRADLFRSPARGTDLLLPIDHVPDPAALVVWARSRGYQIVAVQQTPDSAPYHRADYPPRPLFVLGAEDEGVPPALRAAADLAVEIPLFGAIDSLNVAAAATTVMFQWAVTRSDTP